VQVASQQGKYLAGVMNKHSEHFPGGASTAVSASAAAAEELPAFKYTHLGSMASVGEWKGVVDTPNICKCEWLLCFVLNAVFILRFDCAQLRKLSIADMPSLHGVCAPCCNAKRSHTTNIVCR
jgi:NADH dehydrogenase FAD-containing subunit